MEPTFHTPMSAYIKTTQSSDSDDPENLNRQVLRLSEPKLSQNGSLITKLSNLCIDTPDKPKNPIHSETRSNNLDRPKNFGVSPPRFSSTLTLTTSHPLMGLGSPEGYPDLIPKKIHKVEDEKDLSLSSIEDERNETNGFYSPQRNTSKNNLYFTDNFVTAESILTDSLELPPDVARVKVQRRKIVPKMDGKETPQRILSRNFDGSKIDCGMKISSQSTPKVAQELIQDEFHSGVSFYTFTSAQTLKYGLGHYK